MLLKLLTNSQLLKIIAFLYKKNSMEKCRKCYLDKSQMDWSKEEEMN